LVAVFLAVFRDWSGYLSPGEVGTIKIIAVDRRQARVIYRYAVALLTNVPALASLVARQSDEEIELSNGVVIEIQTANFRSVRGFTIIALLVDEIAYLRNDETSANPDTEILIAGRAAMATLHGNAMLLTAGSPYARRGEQFRAFRNYHGRDDAPVLVWQAATRTMNETVPQSFIDEQMERDPEASAAEYLAEFRSDLADFIDRAVVEALVPAGLFELPPATRLSYVAFCDPSGGSADSMTLAIAHRDRDGRGVLDAVRECRPPFSPESVVEEFAALLKAYGLFRVVGDRYGGEWPVERFSEHGIAYETSERTKSDIYRELLPLLNSRKVDLLDHSRLVNQLCSLERRTARGGRDSIDHPPGAHDDLINAAAGALVLAAGKDDPVSLILRMMGRDPNAPAPPAPAPPARPPQPRPQTLEEALAMPPLTPSFPRRPQ
jgi:hypothetical protein